MTDLDIRTFDVDADPAVLRGWYDAMTLGFLGEDSDDRYAQTLGTWRADRPTFIGVYSPTTVPGAQGLPAAVPVATFATLDRTVNTGRGHHEPTLYITDVTVRTTARRRGILRRLMVDALTDAKARGLTLAALTASEGGIYGRFGFAVSTRWHRAELATDGRFALLHPADDRVELAPSREVAEVRRAVFDAFHRTHRGSHDRLSFYEPMLSGAWDYDKGAPDTKRRTAIHYTEDGTPDGIVAWSFDWDSETVKVADLLAVDDRAELALWQFLGSIDLAKKVEVRRLSPISPLPWALADPRLLKLTETGDFTWERILDVPGALAARAFDADGEVTITVDDPLGLASGSFGVSVAQGRAQVEEVAAPGDGLRVDVRALAGLYFGAVDARTLAAAGLITGPDADVAALTRLFRTDVPPHNASGF